MLEEFSYSPVVKYLKQTTWSVLFLVLLISNLLSALYRCFTVNNLMRVTHPIIGSNKKPTLQSVYIHLGNDR